LDNWLQRQLEIVCRVFYNNVVKIYPRWSDWHPGCLGGITLTPSELPNISRLSSIIRDFLLSCQWQPVRFYRSRHIPHSGWKITAQLNLPLNSAGYCYLSQFPLFDHYGHTYEYHFPSDVLQCTAVV
jgi:hypothetical protein